MASMFDTFKEAAKSAAKGAADTIFAPKPAAVQVVQVPAASTANGIYTPTKSGLPFWALPAAAVAAFVLLSRR